MRLKRDVHDDTNRCAEWGQHTPSTQLLHRNRQRKSLHTFIRFLRELLWYVFLTDPRYIELDNITFSRNRILKYIAIVESLPNVHGVLGTAQYVVSDK